MMWMRSMTMTTRAIKRANAISSNAIEGICNKRLMNLRLMRSKQMQSNANAISSTCNQGHMQSKADAFKG